MRIVRAHSALTMLVLTFVITWTFWIPRALASHSLIEERWPIVLGSVWSHGPLLAAILAATMCGGRAGLRQLVQRVTHGRIGWSPYLIALLAPAAFWLLIAGSAWPVALPSRRSAPDGNLLHLALLAQRWQHPAGNLPARVSERLDQPCRARWLVERACPRARRETCPRFGDRLEMEERGSSATSRTSPRSRTNPASA